MNLTTPNDIIDPIESYDQARQALADGKTVQRCFIDQHGAPVKWIDVTEISEAWDVSRYRIVQCDQGSIMDPAAIEAEKAAFTEWLMKEAPERGWSTDICNVRGPCDPEAVAAWQGWLARSTEAKDEIDELRTALAGVLPIAEHYLNKAHEAGELEYPAGNHTEMINAIAALAPKGEPSP